MSGIISSNRQDRAWAEVSLSALAHNFDAFQRYVRSGCQVIAVLKANAYGHGAVTVGCFLEEKGCPLFAVATFDEAVELREGGVSRPILSLSPIPESLVVDAAKLNIINALPSYAYAQMVSRQSVAHGIAIPCYLMLDCGLSRLGIRVKGQPERALREIQELVLLPGLRIHSVMSHLTAGGIPEQHDLNIEQLNLFRFFGQMMEDQGIHLSKHCCASRFAVRYPDYQFDFVRIGSGLYGVHPQYDVGPQLLPVMQLRARIMQIKQIPAGSFVGYGPSYKTERDTMVAVLPIGYVDGLSPRLAGKMEMLLHGIRVKQIGRFCMDYCMIDVTDVPHASVNDIVTIFGECENSFLSVQEHAAIYQGTASELICLLGRRIPRIYI